MRGFVVAGERVKRTKRYCDEGEWGRVRVEGEEKIRRTLKCERL